MRPAPGGVYPGASPARSHGGSVLSGDSVLSGPDQALEHVDAVTARLEVGSSVGKGSVSCTVEVSAWATAVCV
jgi:hypothetical protein